MLVNDSFIRIVQIHKMRPSGYLAKINYFVVMEQEFDPRLPGSRTLYPNQCVKENT